MLRQTLQGIRAVSSVAVPPLSCWLRRTRATSGQPAGTPPRSLITRAASLPPPRPSGQTTVAAQTSTQALAQALAVGRLMSALGLGCVKTLHRKCRGVAILADCRVGAFFGFDYALIAAMSG